MLFLYVYHLLLLSIFLTFFVFLYRLPLYGFHYVIWLFYFTNIVSVTYYAVIFNFIINIKLVYLCSACSRFSNDYVNSIEIAIIIIVILLLISVTTYLAAYYTDLKLSHCPYKLLTRESCPGKHVCFSGACVFRPVRLSYHVYGLAN